MLRKDLIRPPTLRSGQGRERERHATWLELFYDLVFVAAIAQLANGLYSNLTWHGLLSFVALFIPVWWAWVGQTYYLTRFDSNDAVHRLLAMALIVAAASLVAHVRGGLGPNTAGFAISYAAVRVVLVAEYLRAYIYLPEVRPLTRRYSTGFALAAIIWIISAFVPIPGRFVLWAVGIFVDFFTPIGAGQLHIKFPPHLAHLPERFGLFTIIVLGEAVVSIVVEAGRHGCDIASVLVSLFGLIVAFAFWWGYFEGVRGAETRVLSSNTELIKYQVWIYTHLVLAMGITMTAVAFRHLVEVGYGRLGTLDSWLLSISAGITMLAMAVILAASPTIAVNARFHRYMTPHYILAGLTIAAGVFGHLMSGVALAGIVTGLSVLQIVFSLREPPTASPEQSLPQPDR